MTSKVVWSKYQQEIFKNIATGSGNTLIIARAGSAKSSSIIEGCKYLPKGKKAIFVAFNKSTQQELKEKLPSYTESITTHSLGFRTIKKKFPKIEIDKDKSIKIIEKILNKKDYYLIDALEKTVSLCKATLIDSPSKIDQLIDDYEIGIYQLDRSIFIKYVIDILRSCKEDTSTVNFDDMIWFPLIYGINPDTTDFVFIDECQDLNISQIELALRAVKPNGRIICVLDNFQSIYSWRGADSLMLDKLRKRLKPKELALPISYRCPKKIIYLAQKLVPDIQAWEKSSDGSIFHIHNSQLASLVKPGCFVLSRTNAPLIKNCMGFIKMGIRANILGRDIGDSLIWMIKKSNKSNLNQFLSWLDRWAEKQIKDLKNKGRNSSWVLDKLECFAELSNGATSLEEMQANIKKMFGDDGDKSIVLLSTVHRSKGMERDDVFVLYDTIRKDSQEEKNIEYIAITRARQSIYFVSKNNSII